MDRAELDQMLLDYLRREQDDPIRKRLENQADWMLKHERQDEERHTSLLRAIDAHGYRLGSLEAKAGELADEVEHTGQHHIEELKSKDKRAGERVWDVVKLLLAAVIGAGAGLLSRGH